MEHSNDNIKKINNKISIIIPTFNRCRSLLMVLTALEHQTLNVHGFEVLVIDDGSGDGTEQAVKNFMKKSFLPIRYYYQENKKQGAARNHGIGKSNMPLVLFMGDDIVPDKNFLENHLKFHQSLEDPENSAVIGYTTWHDAIGVTPFMRYIGEYGHQFGYSLIEDQGPLRFNFYYTSNLLMPASVLEKLDHWFDEDFDVYGWEDIELGFRLEQSGVSLYYNAEAVAYHHHPVGIPSFCERQRNVGRASNIFIQKHPELAWLLGDREMLEKKAKQYPAAVVLGQMLGVLDSLFHLSLSHEKYKFVLDVNYAKGAVEKEKNA